jgi:DNA modification methylase
MNRIIQGHCLEVLKTLPNESVHCCVTSPPYWGLRDYGTAKWEGGSKDCNHVVGGQVNQTKDIGTGRDGVYSSGVRPGADVSICLKCGARRIDAQLGLEKTPEEYASKMVEVFREVRRVLRKDGTLWLNLGDSYAANRTYQVPQTKDVNTKRGQGEFNNMPMAATEGCKPKDLVGIPWLMAFALRSDGWYLRSDIIWHKPNPMPESVTDRPTKSHEYIFLLSKSERYYFDSKSVAEPCSYPGEGKWGQGSAKGYIDNPEFPARKLHEYVSGETRNIRSVWSIQTHPYSEAHFATFPEKLIEPCIKAGCPERGIVLDPFMGAGTTAVVARKLNRNYLGIELNPAYIQIAERRIEKEIGLLFEAAL